MQPFEPLSPAFYNRSNVLLIARGLLGKLLITRFSQQLTIGRIVETEAYAGHTDRASHAWNNRRTPRTEVMFGEGGRAYVYLCYGIHQMFNVVTNKKEIPHAILIRAVEPLLGTDIMLQRTGKSKADVTLTRGPGNVAKAFGLHTQHTGMSLMGEELMIATDGYKISSEMIAATPRIGVDYAGEDAALPYRFIVKNNPYVSGSKQQNQNILT